MNVSPDFIYKKLDEACIGHEEAKRWVLSNVSQVLWYIDQLNEEIEDFGRKLGHIDDEHERELEDLRYELSAVEQELADERRERVAEEERAEREEHRLNMIILELEEQLRAKDH